MEQINNEKRNLKELLHKSITKQDIMKFLKNNLLTIYIILNILYILVGSFLVKIYQIFFSEFAQGYIYLFLTNIVAIIILLVTKKYKKDISHLFLILIGVFAIISTIFAVNQYVAIYGTMDRWEGIFSIFYYLTIMFLTSFIPEKNKKTIIYFILFSGVIQTIYGICQVYKLSFVEAGKHSWATGFVQNPNFFSTYMLLNLNYALGLYVDEKKKISKIIYIALSILYMTGLLMSNTTSGIVGLSFVVLYILIYCIKNKQVKKIIVVIAILTCTIIFVEKLGTTNVIKDVLKTTEEATELAKGNVEDDFGSGRMYIWKETLKIVPKHLLHGVGVDNFLYAFDGRMLVSQNYTGQYDKAHNEYLQTLITQGIFSLVSYLALYAVVLKKGIKNSFQYKETYLILPVIGYLVQAFFNISVIEVAPIFYITLGLTVSKQ